MKSRRRSEFTPADAATLGALALVWGFNFLFISLAIAGLTPLWVVAGRTAIGAVLLLAVLGVTGIALPRGKAAWGHLAFLAIPSNVVPWTMVAWAQQTLPSGLTGVLYSLIPLTTFLAAALVRLERLTVRKSVGLVVALAGTAAVVGGDIGAPGRILAMATVLVAVMLLAGGAVYAKWFVSGRVDPLPMAAGQIAVAAVVSAALALWLDPLPGARDLTSSVIFGIVALGVLCTGLAFLLYYRLIERVGATNAASVTYLTPLIALVAGWALLGEEVGLSLLFGAAAIIGGLWYGQRTAPPTGLETGSPRSPSV